MPPSSRRSPRVLPSVDVDVDFDGEPTTVDRIPWHKEDSGIRAVPRPAPRPAPRAAPRPAPRPATRLAPPLPPPPEPPRQDALVRWSPPLLAEDLETLSLPAPLHEDMLPVGVRPEGAAQVRIAIIRVVRALGHDYRLHRGCVLRTDAAAIEITQRQLIGLASEVSAGRAEARVLATEVARYGALLGEIVARRLGGAWIDVSGEHPGLWTMSVPPRTVFTPIGRVHRFVMQRHREQDLVGFFLDLHAASRSRA